MYIYIYVYIKRLILSEIKKIKCMSFADKWIYLVLMILCAINKFKTNVFSFIYDHWNL